MSAETVFLCSGISKRWRVASLDAIAFFAAPELPARR